MTTNIAPDAVVLGLETLREQFGGPTPSLGSILVSRLGDDPDADRYISQHFGGREPTSRADEHRPRLRRLAPEADDVVRLYYGPPDSKLEPA
jgi:hypothetical protein